jgi:hypothetical protein
MPKKRKSVEASQNAINLMGSQATQENEAPPDLEAVPENPRGIRGKVVEVQFRYAQTESPVQVVAEESVVARTRENGVRVASASAHSKSNALDRSFSFAQEVHKQTRGALLLCEERYPTDSLLPVLYLVVRENAAQWKQQLQPLHQQYFQDCDGFTMEIVEQGSDHLLRRLVSAGLVTETVRVTRRLWPIDAAKFFSPLSETEQKKAAAHRQQATRKLKVASVLAAGNLPDEARAALLEAVEPLGRALAVENRLPEPDSFEQALLPPLDAAWKNALPLLRGFLREGSRPVPPLIAAMEQV